MWHENEDYPVLIGAHSASRVVQQLKNQQIKNTDGQLSLDTALLQFNNPSLTKRITSLFLIGGTNESFKESLAFELIDLNHDDDLEFYSKQSIRKSPSISAALLRRIEYNTSRMIATTDFM